jgi:hypothetical protein
MEADIRTKRDICFTDCNLTKRKEREEYVRGSKEPYCKSQNWSIKGRCNATSDGL